MYNNIIYYITIDHSHTHIYIYIYTVYPNNQELVIVDIIVNLILGYWLKIV